MVLVRYEATKREPAGRLWRDGQQDADKQGSRVQGSDPGTRPEQTGQPDFRRSTSRSTSAFDAGRFMYGFAYVR